MTCHKPVTTQYIGELPIDTLESIPDFVLTERDKVDPATGETISSITRTPGAKLFPSVSMDNVFALEANNEAIEVPENQVRACYISNEGSANVMKYADGTHAPMVIAISKLAGNILCQSCGAINIPKTHQYIVGVQYYAGENGEPTTNPASGHKIFIPVSSTKLVINM